MEEWKTDRIENLIDALIDYRGKTPQKDNQGIPLITAKIVKNGRIDTPEEFLAHDDYDSWMRRGYPQIGDVVLTTEAPLGEVAQISYLPVALAQRIVTLRGKEGILDSTYLKYFLQSEIGQKRLSARETGTTVTGIKQSELRKVEITYPSFPTQRKIASILKSIDDKIELNNHINHNLEEQAQIVFDRIFNSDLTNNCLLSSIVDINPKRTLRKNEVARCIDMTYLNTAGSFPSGWEFKPYSGGMKFINGDTLMARITPCLENGKVAYINFLDKEETAFGSTEYIVFHAKEGYPNEMFYFLTRNKAFIEFATKNMNGSSGRQRVSGETIGNYIIPVLSEDDISELKAVSESTMKEILKNNLESRVLSEMRNTILPKLMSGELKINDLTC